MLFTGAVEGWGCAMATVLIVEDSAEVRVLAESYLREQGHQTLSAATCDEALAALDAEEHVDLLFVEISLKDDPTGGLRCGKETTQRHPGLRVLYTTNQVVTDGMRALMVEGSAVLEKPYTVDQLQASLSVHFGLRPVVLPGESQH